METVAGLVLRRPWWARQTLLFWVWSVIGVVAVLDWAAESWRIPGGGWFLPAGVLCCVTAATLRRLARQADNARSALVLGRLGRGAIGAIMEALEWPQARVRDAARLALTNLLAAATPEDAGLLSPEQRTCLYDRLRIADAQAHPEFVTAVLQALPAIGDEGALPGVVRLATMRGYTRNLRAVREAARACLPRMERRVLEQRAAQPAPTAEAMLARANSPEPAPAQPRAPVPPHVEEVLKRVEAEMGNPPQLRVPFLIAAWGVIVPACTGYSIVLWMMNLWYAAIPVALLGVWASQLGRLTLTSRHRRIARELGELDDVNAVGRLAEALAWPDATLRFGAISALTRVLPRLRASDAAMIGPYQRACLYNSLSRETAWSHPDYVVALLRALEQVGDVAAVAPVRALAEARFRTARQRRISEAARECLPYLLNVAEKNQQSQLLLRASHAPGTETDRLLRPAAGVGSHDPEWLLRAADEPNAAEVKAAEG